MVTKYFFIIPMVISLAITGAVYAQEVTEKSNSEEIQILKEEVRLLNEKIKSLETEKPDATEERESIVDEILGRVLKDYDKQSEEEKSMLTIYDNGYVFKGEDDLLKIGGWLQADMRIFEPGYGSDNTFTIRRARMDLRGSLGLDFSYRVFGEFAGGNAALQEAWVGYDHFPFARFKIGQFIEPFSLEALTASEWLDFVELCL